MSKHPPKPPKQISLEMQAHLSKPAPTKGPWRAKGKSVQWMRSGNEHVTPRWFNLEMSEANAQLIAAAPDMLEALRRVSECGSQTCGECSERVDAAIAKAEGK